MKVCEACKIHQFQAGPKDCSQCPHAEPKIPEEDADTWDLWTAIQTQWRVAFGGLVGLDYPAVFQVAAVMGIEIDDLILKKVQGLELHVIAESGKKEEEDNGS